MANGLSPGVAARAILPSNQTATTDALNGIGMGGAYSPSEWVLGGMGGMSPENMQGHLASNLALRQEGLPVYGEGGYHYEGGADVGRRSILPTAILGGLGTAYQLATETGKGLFESGKAIEQGEPISEVLRIISEGPRTGLEDARWNWRGLLSEAPAWERGLQNLGGSIYNVFNRPKEETANLAAGTLRSPFPPTNTTPTTRRIVRALNPNPLKVDVPRPPGGGGFFAGLGGLLSGAAPAAALGLGLPLGMMWPSKISEEQGITSEQIDDNPNSPTFGQIRKEPSSYFDFGGYQNFAPGSSYVPPAGIEEYRRKNDLEEMQLRQEPGLWDRTKGFFGGLLDRGFDPNLQEVPEWNPSAQRTGGFFGDLLSKAMSTAQASVSPTLPPRYVPPPDAAAQQEDLQNRLDQFDKFNPLGVDYEAPPYDPSWNKAAKIPYIRPGLPGRHPEVAAPPATPSARVSQPIIDYPTGIHPPVIQPQAIEPVRESKPEPARESAKDKAAREAREQRSAAKKQAKADTKKAVKRAVKKSTATKSVKKVVTSKKNISDAVAAARGDVKSAVTIALTSGDAQRAWAKAKGIDPSTIYGSTLRKTADGRWAGGF